MNYSEIATWKDLLRFLLWLSEQPAKSYKRSLEEYLRALWALVEPHQNTVPSYALLGQLLAEALNAEPAPFDESWLSYSKLPEQNLSKQGNGYEYLKDRLLFQITDLRKMALAGTLNDPQRYFGITSPSGHKWYNFDPESFLSCAAAGLGVDNDDDDDEEDEEPPECSWKDLVSILGTGQVYE